MSTPLGVRPLYHFTCIDGHARIGRYNCLLMPQSMWPFVWLTTEPVPDFDATGLTSVTLRCDRTQFRYVVTDVSTCRPWLGSPERGRVDRDFLQTLEEFGDPEHWWISPGPVRAEWDRTWRVDVPARGEPVPADQVRRWQQADAAHKAALRNKRGKRPPKPITGIRINPGGR